MRYVSIATATVVAFSVVLATEAFGYWQEYDGAHSSSGTRESTIMETGFKASWLFGRTVWNSEKQDVGSLTELVVAENGRIKYAVLDQGGLVGRGLLGRGVSDELYAVPWSAIEMDTKERKLNLDLTMAELRETPTFKKGEWESFENPKFEGAVHGYYGVGEGFQVESEEQASMHGTYKASTFMGGVVKNLQGEELGYIHDMIAGVDGRIKYVIVSQGGGLFGIGSKRLPVPWSALQFDAEHFSGVLDMEKSKFTNAPNIAGSNWRVFDHPEWEATVHEYYGANLNH